MESIKPFGAGIFWLLVIAEIVAAVSLGLAQTQSADLSTRAGGGGKPTASLRMDPTQPLAGIPFMVYGSGFKRGETVYVGLEGYFGLDNVTADDSGSFTYAYTKTPQTAGTYKLIALAYRQKAWEVVASVPFTVSDGSGGSGTTAYPGQTLPSGPAQ